ncbi:MAG TPA: bifunctional shikimate kinase/3-dehydroquinate synthase [Gaiellaceae bacterium]|nr:bifunctional shikimate kinase/3-dehydroquinate synthase [Gaiellaceae bacterium]
MAPHALDRHLALVGFMGAGKSTLGPLVAERLGRPFVSVDEIVEERAGEPVAEIFERHGEAEFRRREEETAADVLARRPLGVVEVGGGALGSERTRAALAAHAFTVHLETSPDEAWKRVAGSARPLARDPDSFQALFEERKPLYESADASATDLDGVVLAAAGVRFASHKDLEATAVIADAHVAELHGIDATRTVPRGEAAKSLAEAERLWRGLTVDRGATLGAIGGGSTTDLVGFVAATYLRGIDWIAVPSTLVGQVDAAIGGKVGIDLPEGKNLVGAFHWPSRTVIDPTFLETLPEEERRNGLAEVVKTGLLLGEPLWELGTYAQVRTCAAFKAGICLRDPFDRGDRAQLNLGHTFAHALEAASGYTLPHGRAVALGLLAACRLSGLDDEARVVERVLAPAPVAVDRDTAWAALRRDKKTVGGAIHLVLLERPGRPGVTSEIEPARVRAALDALIA